MKKKQLQATFQVKELVKPRATESIYANSKIVESLCRSRNGACRTNNADDGIDQDLIF